MESVLIQNGRVFDGQAYICGDILIRDGIIAGIAPKITGADRVYDAGGMLVLPGLVDVHLHMKGISSPKWSIDPGAGTLPFGVTAAADASASRGDQAYIDALPAKSGVFIIVGTKEPFHFDTALERVARYGDRVLGMKVLYDRKADPELRDEKKLVAICEFAHSRGLPVAVHTANSPVPMDVLLSVLAPGDIATHVFHSAPNSAAQDDFACLRKAKERGVYLDSCICAGFHVDFDIYRSAIEAGIYPDLIGTDLADEIGMIRGMRYGIPGCMTVARILGMPEEAVLRAVTGNAGKALRRPWGRLREGTAADIAVLQWRENPMDLTDQNGHRLTGRHGYCCRLTVADGKVVHDTF